MYMYCHTLYIDKVGIYEHITMDMFEGIMHSVVIPTIQPRFSQNILKFSYYLYLEFILENINSMR